MSYISRKLHSVIYGITDYERLSSAAMAIPDKSVLFIAPVAGGISSVDEGGNHFVYL